MKIGLPLMKVGLPLVKNVLTPLAKSVLILLGLTVTTSAIDAAIKKENLCVKHGSFDNLIQRNERYHGNR